MKASEAKPYIGKLVKYYKRRWTRPRYGVVKEIAGRNIILETDALWAPDIHGMQLAEDVESEAADQP